MFCLYFSFLSPNISLITTYTISLVSAISESIMCDYPTVMINQVLGGNLSSGLSSYIEIISHFILKHTQKKYLYHYLIQVTFADKISDKACQIFIMHYIMQLKN